MMKGVFRCTAIILTHEPIRGNPRRQNGPADEGGVLIEKTEQRKGGARGLHGPNRCERPGEEGLIRTTF